MIRESNVFLNELKLPFRKIRWLSVPGDDVRWRKQFRIELDPVGIGDNDAVVILGIADDGLDPTGEVIVEDILLEPDDAFSFRNIAIENRMIDRGAQRFYYPESRAQQTVDIAVVADFMHVIEFPIQNGQLFSMTFTNTGAGFAGIEGMIVGRIPRKPAKS